MPKETTPAQMPAPMDKNAAKSLLEEEKKKRAELCAKEIGDVLKKHNCSMDVVMIVGSKGNVPQFNIIPQE